MTTKPSQAAKPQAPIAQDGTDAAVRSDNLLPDDGKSDDGRFDVAEEVSLDQQSDTARRVGEAPAGGAADAIAESLRDQKATGPGGPQK